MICSRAIPNYSFNIISKIIKILNANKNAWATSGQKSISIIEVFSLTGKANK
jgi:hypothetical protein